MPGTRRTPIGRTPGPRLTPRALDLFEHGARLMRRGPNTSGLSDVSYELALELGLKPWNDCPLVDCQSNEPPRFLTTEAEISDWWRSKAIRRELQTALQERRKARREAPPETPPT
jgi:hypothetical protein